jgi:hypothetical protein
MADDKINYFKKILDYKNNVYTCSMKTTTIQIQLPQPIYRR